MAAAHGTVTACVLLIGNEILSGRTQDANLAYLAAGLDARGVRVREARVIADSEGANVAAVNECRRAFDYVLTTGGIGPTHDDITAGCIAKALGVALEKNAQAMARLGAHYAASGLEFNAARQRMAMVPAGAELIDNPVSAAPGFWLENVYVLAGVPAIMRAMFDSIAHAFAGGAPMHSVTLTTDLAEGTMAAALGELQARFDAVEIGSYPFFARGAFGVSIVLRSTDAAGLAGARAGLEALIDTLGGGYIDRPELTS